MTRLARGRPAWVRRLVIAEVLARPGEGPLAPLESGHPLSDGAPEPGGAGAIPTTAPERGTGDQAGGDQAGGTQAGGEHDG